MDTLEVIHAVDVMVQGFLQLFPRHLDDLIGHVALHHPHKVLHLLPETQYNIQYSDTLLILTKETQQSRLVEPHLQ